MLGWGIKKVVARAAAVNPVFIRWLCIGKRKRTHTERRPEFFCYSAIWMNGIQFLGSPVGEVAKTVNEISYGKVNNG